MGQSINPIGTYLDDNGDSVTMAPGDSYSGSAPLAVHFAANPTDLDGYSAYYEWRFYSEKDTSTPLYTRYDENTDFTLHQSGLIQDLPHREVHKGRRRHCGIYRGRPGADNRVNKRE